MFLGLNIYFSIFFLHEISEVYDVEENSAREIKLKNENN